MFGGDSIGFFLKVAEQVGETRYHRAEHVAEENGRTSNSLKSPPVTRKWFNDQLAEVTPELPRYGSDATCLVNEARCVGTIVR